jgi:hypothetical protein
LLAGFLYNRIWINPFRRCSTIDRATLWRLL